MFRGRSASPYAMPDWTTLYAPRRCKKCGQPLPSGDTTEMYRQMTEAYNAMYAPLMENLSRMWGGGGGSATPWSMPYMAAYMPGQQATMPGMPGMRHRKHDRPHHHRHHHDDDCDCGCEHEDCDGCHHDDCRCHCCIHDADLVVHARLGETRVVALTIENPRRRERQVRLELSNWTTRSGSPAEIQARIVPPAEFTLGPCAERDVILVVEAGIKDDTPTPQPTPNTPGEVPNPVPAGTRVGFAAMAATAAAAADRDVIVRRVPDVEQCEVFYADLRVEGCDTRPVRIALVLLPRDCAAHPIDCGCGCC